MAAWNCQYDEGARGGMYASSRASLETFVASALNRTLGAVEKCEKLRNLVSRALELCSDCTPVKGRLRRPHLVTAWADGNLNDAGPSCCRLARSISGWTATATQSEKMVNPGEAPAFTARLDSPKRSAACGVRHPSLTVAAGVSTGNLTS